MNSLSSLKRNYYQFKNFIDHLSDRDRAIISGAWVLTVFALWFLVFLKPVMSLRSEANKKNEAILKQSKEITNKKAQIDAVIKDPDTEGLLQDYQKLNAKLNEVNERITHYKARYINQDDLSKVLHDIVKQTMGVNILTFSTVNKIAALETPIPPITQPANTTSNVTIKPLKQVGMDSIRYHLVLSGGYFNVLNYLKRLEQIPWNLYWEKFDYQVKNYPQAIVVLDFYTLNPETYDSTRVGNI